MIDFDWTYFIFLFLFEDRLIVRYKSVKLVLSDVIETRASSFTERTRVHMWRITQIFRVEQYRKRWRVPITLEIPQFGWMSSGQWCYYRSHHTKVFFFQCFWLERFAVLLNKQRSFPTAISLMALSFLFIGVVKSVIRWFFLHCNSGFKISIRQICI